MRPGSVLRVAPRLIVAVSLAASLAVSNAAPASAAGEFDPSFGGDGMVTTDLGTWDVVYAVAVQPDGRIVAVGRGGDRDIAVVRYLADGTADASFGTGGRRIINLGEYEVARDVVIQRDGRIVVAGYTTVAAGSGDFMLARLLTNGTLDSTFGAGGIVRTDFAGGFDIAFGLQAMPDGRIVAAGYTTTGNLAHFALARYTANGTLDPTFGTGGRVRDRVGTNQGNNLNDIVLQPDGKVVVAGATSPDGREFDFVVGRYDAAGRPDPTFGTGGKVVTEFLGDGFATALVLQPDGRIVAAGEARAPADPTRFALARYTASGRLDGTFGSGGKVTTAWDTSASAADVALQPDGRIIAAGSATSRNADYDFAIARYTATGRLDPGFGDRGQIVTNFAGRSTDEALAVTIYPDDRVIVAGSTGPHDLDGDFALARYLAPPTGSSETHLIVRDTFGRTLANNWGRADAGGPYSLLSRASDYDVDGRTGTMLLPASRATRRAVLTQISARDVAFSFRVTTNRAPYRPGGGSGQYAYFIARRTPDGSEYRMRIRFSPTGSTYVHASRYVAGQGERSLGPEVPIDASAYAPSTYYRVEGDVLGSGPTTLRIRAYPDGQSAPVGYRGQWIDGTTGLQGAGAVGLQSYVSLTDAPVIVRFDDLYVEARSAP